MQRLRNIAITVLCFMCSPVLMGKDLSYTNWPDDGFWSKITNEIGWCRSALIERRFVIGMSTNVATNITQSTYITPLKDFQQIALQIAQIAGDFVATNEVGANGTYDQYFATPSYTTNQSGQIIATNYPTDFPHWTASNLMKATGTGINNQWHIAQVLGNSWMIFANKQLAMGAIANPLEEWNIETVDTDRDGLVDVGVDMQRPGLDTGTITFLPEYPYPVSILPLYVPPAWHKGLSIHGYFTSCRILPYQYLVPSLEDHDGYYTAFSFNTRIVETVADTNAQIKRVEILRPMGNVVFFDFPWKGGTNGFSSIGYPMGTNANRTYILRDLTPASHDDGAYDLCFRSGIVHHFLSGLSSVSDVSGFSIGPGLGSAYGGTISTNTAGSTNCYYAPAASMTARYNAGVEWDRGLIAKITYTNNGQTVTTTVGYSADGKTISSVVKNSSDASLGIGMSDAVLNGNTISYGDGRTLSRSGTNP